MNQFEKKLEEFKAWAANRPKLEQQPQEPAKTLPVQLPMWPEAVRAVPNGFLRSALFGAIRKGRRRYMQGEQIAALDGIEIRYTGQQLDQGDLDVWESVLHVARVQELGTQCRFTAYSLLKLIDKKDTGSNRETLHARLMRLKATAVEISHGRYSYAGSLIDEVYRDKETQQYVVILNPKLHALFATDGFTQIEWAIRRELDGHQLAQWLHGFFSSHAQPHPVKIETLHRLCGSESALMSDFAKKLRKALDAVAEACAARGESFTFAIRNNILYVEKTPSLSQIRHLTKRIGIAKCRKPRR
jgi:hypothetical protein